MVGGILGFQWEIRTIKRRERSLMHPSRHGLGVFSVTDDNEYEDRVNWYGMDSQKSGRLVGPMELVD